MLIRECCLLPDLPGPPENVKATDVSKRTISLTWEPPLSDGGLAIVGYIVEQRQTSSSRWVTLTKAPVAELNYTVSDVVENQEYEFRISAKNGEGVGPPSAICGPIKAKDPYGQLSAESLYDQ